MAGMVEIITGRERRRRWSVEEKLRIVAETHEPDARIRDVAARHSVCESLVFTWRRQAREGMLTLPEPAVFMPVCLREEAAPPVSMLPGDADVRPPSPGKTGAIEIELPNGSKVRVGHDVNPLALRRVLTALRG